VLANSILEKLFAEGRSAILVGGTGFYIRALVEQFTDLLPAPDPELRAYLNNMLDHMGLQHLVDKLKEVNEAAAAKVDLNNPIRVTRALEKALDDRPPIKFQLPPFEVHKLGIVPSAEESNRRIEARTDQMILSGWIQEVIRLESQGVQYDDPAMRAIGYRELWEFIATLGVEEAQKLATEDTASDQLSLLKSRITLETVQYAKRQRTWLRSEPRLHSYETAEQCLEDIQRRLNK
jgi:tRNA dimethylallyltransferase